MILRRSDMHKQNGPADQDARIPAQRTAEPPRCVWRAIVYVLLAPFVLYVVSFVVVFDVTRAASSWDEDNVGNEPVAIGPRPRACFDPPTHWDVAYETSQWSFVVYRPLCEIWLWIGGYAPPCEWRAQSG
jgi:hypothetical protein